MGILILPTSVSVSVGANCIARNIISGDSTVVILANTIPTDGTITSWCTYISNKYFDDYMKLKVFRIVGETIVFVGESPEARVSVGLNSGLTANIAVKAGDLVSFYLGSAFYMGWTNNSSGYLKYTRLGDISSDSLKSSWSYSTGSGPWSVQAQVTTETEVIDCSPTKSRGATVQNGIPAGKGKSRR